MKTYNNGQRKGMMYGGGATPRKPMMYGGMTKKKMNMGGLAQENRKRTTAQSPAMNPTGNMTEQKKFSMGMMYGGTAKKKKMNMGGELTGGQTKLDMNKDGRISGKDFKMMK
jgi:hypothetical protein